MKKEIERFVTTDPDELLKIRFSRFRSPEIAKKLLLDKCNQKDISVNQDLINEKAKGLSSIIDSALSYFQIKEQSLNARILSRYYALLQFTIAEEVASIENTVDLKVAQKYTEKGHGLNTLNQYIDSNFLDNFFCYFRNLGHFYHYLQQAGYSKDENLFIAERLKQNENISNEHLLSLSDLFRRIPELQNIIEEYTDKCPLVLHFGRDSTEVNEKYNERRELSPNITNTSPTTVTPQNNEKVKTFIAIYPSSERMTIEYLRELKTPFSNFKIKNDTISDSEYVTCEFHHSNEGSWWNSIKYYKSSFCPTSYIIPIFDKINDPIVINFALMYSLSILVRYLPNIWCEITVGKLSKIGNLIDYYLSVFDHVIPKQMYERITGKSIHISMPGGWDAFL
ncbi:MAG: hypothetical protein GF353_11820 [Candidatus Lokiarchaeota archaeon]|nr:hypothetical protein [Candidatus Lokiarchaeota archaeon]